MDTWEVISKHRLFHISILFVTEFNKKATAFSKKQYLHCQEKGHIIINTVLSRGI